MCSTEFKSSLPPAAAATHLVDVYFQYRTPHFPVLDRAEILASVQTAYRVFSNDPATISRSSRRDLFVTFIFFAVSLCGLQIGSGGRPVESEGCFHSALQYIDSAIGSSDSDTETLGNILLLAQYISLSPSKGNLWLLSGIALRICVNIGLHWETDAALQLEPGHLKKRRRLFWATYNLERLLGVTLGRPFSIEEQSVSVGYPDAPSPADFHSQLVVNHLLKLSRLESEIKHVLYRHQKRGSLAFPSPDIPRWMEDIQPRLEEWRASIPPIRDVYHESIYAFSSWWDATFYNTLMLLHRPNPSIPEPGPDSLRICFDAAKKLIACAQILQREHQLEMAWIWAQRLFVAGLTFIYTVWNSVDLRRSNPPEEIVHTAQTCSTTLAVLTGRFPSAAGCRDALETLVSATVKALFSSQPQAFTGSTEGDTSENSSAGMAILQPDINLSMESMYSMLSGDMFGMAQGVAWSGFSDNALFDFADQQPTNTEWSVFDEDGQSYNAFM
ncbi:uncharacterized protein E0L32_003984 [Thyridium curvatum]|uniref:Xylanolytic transcriptional activator regulatory domain-containing protein n=1 Tax=Thyridium curvatum TaxID=1093900 RepID=A0A507AZR5_9PEZI|nr:uncharacterized protein E0L32_003984 [Thyridium curvatum]TPX16335.1 hypothetical protein E0L32_003984 [Thyridium curvatum]